MRDIHIPFCLFSFFFYLIFPWIYSSSYLKISSSFTIQSAKIFTLTKVFFSHYRYSFLKFFLPYSRRKEIKRILFTNFMSRNTWNSEPSSSFRFFFFFFFHPQKSPQFLLGFFFWQRNSFLGCLERNGEDNRTRKCR